MKRGLILLVAAMLVIALAGCSARSLATSADEDSAEGVALALPVSAGGTGTVTAIFTGIGGEGPTGRPLTRRWISLDSSVTVRGEAPHAELGYDASTRFLVGGRPLSSLPAHKPPLGPAEVAGWPARVEYERTGNGVLRATVVDVQVPADWDGQAADGK